MRALAVDICWWIGTFVVVTALVHLLHRNGVDVPSLPSWVWGY